jgi:PAS domain S-box-containing protein
VTAAALLSLFYLPYWSVRKKTIAAFNNEQMILAHHAIKGIQSFFDPYDKALRYFVKQPSIIHLDESGQALMDDFLTIHASDLSAVIRIDEQGKILYSTSPGDGIVGRDVPGEGHNFLIMQTHQSVISDVFITTEGLRSVAFAYPVFDNETYVGCISFLIPFDQIVGKYLQKINVADRALTMMIGRNGEGLYCSEGRSEIREDSDCFAEAPAIGRFKEKMMEGRQGSASFSADLSVDGEGPSLTRYAVYAPVQLPGDNFWSIMVASPENVVLSTMRGFRNQWFMVTAVVLCAVLLLSYLLTRTMARNREVQKRRVVEEQLLRLLDFTPMGMGVYDVHGILSYANQAVVQLLDGVEAEEILGRDVFEFVHPDYKEFIASRFEKLKNGQTTEIAVIKIVTLKGVVKDAEINSTPFIFSGQTSFISILKDVTEDLKQEATQRRLVTAIEQANETVIITDQAGIVEYVNPAFSRTTGYDKEEIIGRNPRLLRSNKHDVRFYRNMWRTLTSGRVWQGRIINRRKDGGLITEMATISPVRDVTGKITHYVAVNRNVSHEVELEAKLRQAQKMEAIGTLAGGIAHDFNNILGAILGFTDMALLQSDPASPLRETLLHIRKGGKRAADLVQQILTFSRQSSVEKKPIAVTPLVKESLQLLRASLPSTISIHQELQAEDALVLADATQLQQIVLNLCTNAFQAMREQGGQLTVRLETLPIEDCGKILETEQERCIRLMVSDTGYGVSPAVVERIFDPFFTTKKPGEGTGMGLSVVHGIISDIGGEISIESTPGHGATFSVLLPMADPSGEDMCRTQVPLPMGTEHILVVDDEEDILATSRMMLVHLGYTVSVSKEASVALEEIKNGKQQCDLVVTDQTMPGLTGLEFARELHQAQPELPVILCTGYSDKVNEESIKVVGAVGLLMKPIELRDLAVMIRNALDRER